MQDLVLIFNIKLTFISSTILSIFEGKSNKNGHFRTKIQHVHLFQIAFRMVVWGSLKVYR